MEILEKSVLKSMLSKDNIKLKFTMDGDTYLVQSLYGGESVDIQTLNDVENYMLYGYLENDGTWVLQVNPPSDFDANGERIMPCVLGIFDNMIQLLEAMHTAERNRYLFPELQGYYD